MTAGATHREVIDRTRAWIERAVIGLNLCPFARAVYVNDRVRFVVSDATSRPALLSDFEAELRHLVATDPVKTDTTVLIHPGVLRDFLEYNDFLGEAEDAIDRLGLGGVLQLASFHPDYQFAGVPSDDITNCTNRSPYPILHLLREASVDRAVEAFPEASLIYERNLTTLRRLGRAGWLALGLPATDDSGNTHS